MIPDVTKAVRIVEGDLGYVSPIVLEAGTFVLDYADRARTAMLDFIVGARVGWDKRGLADWLTGPYQHATVRLTPGILETARTDAPVSSQRVSDLIDQASQVLLSALMRCINERDQPLFVPAMLRQGAVCEARDSGRSGFVAVNAERLSLSNRALSLLVADYLTRPSEYAGGAELGTRDHAGRYNAIASVVASMRRFPHVHQARAVARRL